MEEQQTPFDLNTADYPILANDLPERAAERFRLALQLIRKHDAPVIPLNYALCYFYVAGSNLLFNENMDRHINHDTPWDHETATRLFMRHFTPCSDASMVELQKDLLSVVNDIIGSVIDCAGKSGERTERLDQQMERLRASRDTQQAIKVAAEVLAEARAFAVETRALESGLRSSAQQVTRLKEELLHARREASIDALTGLHNRRAFDATLETLMLQARVSSSPFSVVFVDVDHFKRINDDHGHLVGDRVLRQLARQLTSRTRAADAVARYGGEEFAILLPETRLQEAERTAENIRESIGRLNMRRTDNSVSLGKITASFGVAEYRRGETAQELLARADSALYQAKREGRDRVVCSFGEL